MENALENNAYKGQSKWGSSTRCRCDRDHIDLTESLEKQVQLFKDGPTWSKGWTSCPLTNKSLDKYCPREGCNHGWGCSFWSWQLLEPQVSYSPSSWGNKDLSTKVGDLLHPLYEFSNFICIRITWRWLLKHRLLGTTPESDLLGLDWGWSIWTSF